MFSKKNDETIEQIYQNIVEISRSKIFYVDLELDDNFETRFDLVIFHAFMIFYFYKVNSDNKSKIPQELFDYMFSDFENNLREMGFGDIAVNKKMKKFINAFYGRIAQYNKSLDNLINDNDKSLIQKSILNNIYKGKCSNENMLNHFTNYIETNTKRFISKTETENLNEYFKFLKISY